MTDVSSGFYELVRYIRQSESCSYKVALVKAKHLVGLSKYYYIVEVQKDGKAK